MNSFLILCLVTVFSVISTEGKWAENVRALKEFKIILAAMMIDHIDRITKGEAVEPHSVPSQAYIELAIDFNPTGSCGGSLLTIGTVITAGHCCARANTKGTQVILGAHNIKEEEPTQQLIAVKGIALHEKYDDISEDGLSKNDICIMFLKKNATLNEAVQTIKLPSLKDADNDFAGETAIATGWGLLQYAPELFASVLQMVKLPILSNDECQKKVDARSIHATITPTNLCTYGHNGRNTCEGDSGGPLTVTDKDGQQILVGLTSAGSVPCERTLSPSMFTRVTKYLDWIAKTAHIDIAE